MAPSARSSLLVCVALLVFAACDAGSAVEGWTFDSRADRDLPERRLDVPFPRADSASRETTGTTPRSDVRSDASEDARLDTGSCERRVRPASEVCGQSLPTEVCEHAENGDSDWDGLPRSEEQKLCGGRGTDPKDPDTDNDNLSDCHERELGTDPCKADTDGDGVEDGREVRRCFDPTDPNSPAPHEEWILEAYRSARPTANARARESQKGYWTYAATGDLADYRELDIDERGTFEALATFRAESERFYGAVVSAPGRPDQDTSHAFRARLERTFRELGGLTTRERLRKSDSGLHFYEKGNTATAIYRWSGDEPVEIDAFRTRLATGAATFQRSEVRDLPTTDTAMHSSYRIYAGFARHPWKDEEEPACNRDPDLDLLALTVRPASETSGPPSFVRPAAVAAAPSRLFPGPNGRLGSERKLFIAGCDVRAPKESTLVFDIPLAVAGTVRFMAGGETVRLDSGDGVTYNAADNTIRFDVDSWSGSILRDEGNYALAVYERFHGGCRTLHWCPTLGCY